MQHTKHKLCLEFGVIQTTNKLKLTFVEDISTHLQNLIGIPSPPTQYPVLDLVLQYAHMHGAIHMTRTVYNYCYYMLAQSNSYHFISLVTLIVVC